MDRTGEGKLVGKKVAGQSIKHTPLLILYLVDISLTSNYSLFRKPLSAILSQSEWICLSLLS